MASDAHRGRLLPAILMFIVVGGGVFLTGLLASWVLKTILLPIIAILMGWGAARFVYRTRD